MMHPLQAGKKTMKSASEIASGWFKRSLIAPKSFHFKLSIDQSKKTNTLLPIRPLRSDQVSVHSRWEIPPWSHVCSPPPCTHGQYHCGSWLRSVQGCEWKPMWRRVPGNIQGGKNARRYCTGHATILKYIEYHIHKFRFLDHVPVGHGYRHASCFENSRLVVDACTVHSVWQCPPQP